MELIHVRRIIFVFVFSLGAALLTGCTDSQERRQAYFDKGVALFEAGDFARARLELKNVLQIDDQFAPGWHWMGRVEERDGDFRKAFGDYNRALELDPNHLPSLIRRGQIFLLAKDLESAGKDAEAAIKLAPTDPDALVLRAALRKRNGDDAGSEQDVRAALAAKPGHATASAMMALLLFEQGSRDEAIEVLKTAIAANPDNQPLQVVLGRYYHETGNIQGAIDTLSGLAKAHPDNTNYQNKLAGYLVQQGREDEAEKALRNALAAAPTDYPRQRALIELVGRLRGTEAALAEIRALREANDSMSLRFAEADLLRALKRGDQAEQGYRDIIEASGGTGPDAIKARNALAALLAEDRGDEAAALIGAVLQESPTEPDALQLRAALALRNGQPDQAIADLRTVLGEFPDRIAAQRLIGQAHAAKGESALAQDAFEKAIAIAPTDTLAYLQLAELRVRSGDSEGALLVLESLLDKVPDNEAAQQAIAKIQLSSRDWDALGATAERIRATRPQHPLGYYLEGLLLQREGDHAAAVEAFEQALEASPDAVEPLLGLARSQLALGRPEQAEQRVLGVMRYNPNSLVAMTQLGDIYAATEQYDKAIETFDEVTRFHPKSPRAYERLFRLQLQIGDAAAARATLERGVKETDRSGFLLFRLAALLEQSADYAAAIEIYEEVLQQYPDANMVANNLAVLLSGKAGEHADLDRAFELAQRFADSQLPEYLDTLGWIRYLRGEYQAALPLLERAVAGKPALGELQYHLGMTYARLGQVPEAREHLQLAVVSENFTDKDAAQAALAALN